MIVHYNINDDRYIVGRGFVKSRGSDKKYIHGKGVVEDLLVPLFNFAKDPESAVNVGKTVVDVASTAKKVYDAGKEINDTMKLAKKIKKMKIMDIIDDINSRK